LAGEAGPVRDAVLLNAAAGLAAHAGGDDPLTDRLEAALRRAVESIDSGAAGQTLTRWAEVSKRHAPS
jgi:anthranilate phosphoribosyltransferase